jgi:hypothetical protein
MLEAGLRDKEQQAASKLGRIKERLKGMYAAEKELKDSRMAEQVRLLIFTRSLLPFNLPYHLLIQSMGLRADFVELHGQIVLKEFIFLVLEG